MYLRGKTDIKVITNVKLKKLLNNERKINMEKEISKYLGKMKKEMGNTNKVVAVVDTNDGDYSHSETPLGGSKFNGKITELVLESSIVLKTFYGEQYGIDGENGYINGLVEEYLGTIEDETERERKESFFEDGIPFEYLTIYEGHTLESITVYYNGEQYEVESVTFEEIDEILTKWEKRFSKVK